ncbi:MAG: hypothetical protein JJ903_16205, partial [Spongiibacter sp.]|nr:hypothetical protein [Spongiibacter sp.]
MSTPSSASHDYEAAISEIDRQYFIANPQQDLVAGRSIPPSSVLERILSIC